MRQQTDDQLVAWNENAKNFGDRSFDIVKI
jgi:hypothetical protein